MRAACITTCRGCTTSFYSTTSRGRTPSSETQSRNRGSQAEPQWDLTRLCSHELPCRAPPPSSKVKSWHKEAVVGSEGVPVYLRVLNNTCAAAHSYSILIL